VTKTHRKRGSAVAFLARRFGAAAAWAGAAAACPAGKWHLKAQALPECQLVPAQAVPVLELGNRDLVAICNRGQAVALADVDDDAPGIGMIGLDCDGGIVCGVGTNVVVDGIADLRHQNGRSGFEHHFLRDVVNFSNYFGLGAEHMGDVFDSLASADGERRPRGKRTLPFCKIALEFFSVFMRQ